MTRRSFAPGKLILSGEYAVVFGKKGIAIPSSMGLTVRFEEQRAADGIRIEWPKINEEWKQYLGRIVAECASMKGDAIRGTLTIDNQLPLGKGMGSSTAMVIAVARSILGDDCREQAKQIEDIVNPGNSGLDFEVIWEEKPVVFEKGSAPRILERTIELPNMRLIDTGSPGESTPELVAWVKERLHEPAVARALETIDECTQRLLDGESVFMVFPDHHRAQVALGVIPEEVQELIETIEKEGGAAKVIGAGGRTGGGGMVLSVKRDDSR